MGIKKESRSIIQPCQQKQALMYSRDCAGPIKRNSGSDVEAVMTSGAILSWWLSHLSGLQSHLSVDVLYTKLCPCRCHGRFKELHVLEPGKECPSMYILEACRIHAGSLQETDRHSV